MRTHALHWITLSGSSGQSHTLYLFPKKSHVYVCITLALGLFSMVTGKVRDATGPNNHTLLKQLSCAFSLYFAEEDAMTQTLHSLSSELSKVLVLCIHSIDLISQMRFRSTSVIGHLLLYLQAVVMGIVNTSSQIVPIIGNVLVPSAVGNANPTFTLAKRSI